MANAAAAKEQEEQQTEEEASQQEVQEQPVEDTPEVIAWRNGRAAGVLLVSLGVVAVLAAGLLLLVFYFVNLRETRRAAGERLREREEKRIPKLSDNARVLKMYLMAPNRWWLRVIIVAIVALILAWSASSIQYNGLASKGSEVASGVVWGISHPDTNLLFNSTSDGVLYQLLETMAIALLGHAFWRHSCHTVQLSRVGYGCSQMACVFDACVYFDDSYYSQPRLGAGMDSRRWPRPVLRCVDAKHLFHWHDFKNVYYRH